MTDDNDDNDGGAREPFVEMVNDFERRFRYPDEIHFDPRFWLEHLHQQVNEAEESRAEGDIDHMVVELADTILVAWRAIQIFGSGLPEEIIARRIDLNLDEKGAEAIMEKYTEWWLERREGDEPELVTDGGTDPADPAEDIERDLAEARRPVDLPDPTEDIDEE